MKNIKTIFISVFLSLLVLPSLSSCKKGEGDPILSIHSRKARVAGAWTVENWKEQQNYTSNFNTINSSSSQSGSRSYEISGSKLSIASTFMSNVSSGNVTDEMRGNGEASMRFTFEKDGTFKRMIIYDSLSITKVSGASVTSILINQTYETTGTWNFLGGMEADFKNKERIILNILKEKIVYSHVEDGIMQTGTEVNSYANRQYSEIWHIHTLKNKKMILDGEINGTETHSFVLSNMFGYSPGASNSNTSGNIEGNLVQQ